MNLLRTVNRGFIAVESALLVFFLGGMVLLAFAQVVLRNLFGSGLIWADPIIRHLVIWAGFLGAALATNEERHISIDALTRFLPPRIRHASLALTSLFAAVVCVFLGIASWSYLLEEYAAGAEIVLSIPTWAAITIIPAGYFLIALHFAVRALEHLLRLTARQQEVQ